MHHNAVSSGQPSQPLVARGMEVSIEHLRLVFHLPSEQAAIALGVTHSRVKRACRKLNLDRWPQRKLASLSLLQGVVEKDEQMPEDDQRMVLKKIKSEYDALVENPNHHLDPELEALRLYLWKMKHYVKLKAARQAGLAPRSKSKNPPTAPTTTDNNNSQSLTESGHNPQAGLSAPLGGAEDEETDDFGPLDLVSPPGPPAEASVSRKRVASDSVSNNAQEDPWSPSRVSLVSGSLTGSILVGGGAGLQAGRDSLHSKPAGLHSGFAALHAGLLGGRGQAGEEPQVGYTNKRSQPASRVGSCELGNDIGRQSGNGARFAAAVHAPGSNVTNGGPPVSATRQNSDSLLGWSRPGSNSGFLKTGFSGGAAPSDLGISVKEQTRKIQVAPHQQSVSQLSDLISRLTAANPVGLVDQGRGDDQHEHWQNSLKALAATAGAEPGPSGQIRHVISHEPQAQQPHQQHLQQQVRQHPNRQGGDQSAVRLEHKILEMRVEQGTCMPQMPHMTPFPTTGSHFGETSRAEAARLLHASDGKPACNRTETTPPYSRAAPAVMSSIAAALCAASSKCIKPRPGSTNSPGHQNASNGIAVSRQDLPQFSRSLGAPCITSYQQLRATAPMVGPQHLLSHGVKKSAPMSPDTSLTPSPTASTGSLPDDLTVHISHRTAPSLMLDTRGKCDSAHHPGIGPRVQMARRHHILPLSQQLPPSQQQLQQQSNTQQQQRPDDMVLPDSKLHASRSSNHNTQNKSDMTSIRENSDAASLGAHPDFLNRINGDTARVTQPPPSARIREDSNSSDAVNLRGLMQQSARQPRLEPRLAHTQPFRAPMQPETASHFGGNKHGTVPDANPQNSQAGLVYSVASEPQQPRHLAVANRFGLDLTDPPTASSWSGNIQAPFQDQQIGQPTAHHNQAGRHEHQSEMDQMQWTAKPLHAGFNQSAPQPPPQRHRQQSDTNTGTAWQQQAQPHPCSVFAQQQQQQSHSQRHPNPWQQHSPPTSSSHRARDDSSSEVSSLLTTIQQGWSNGASGASMQQQALGMLQALAALATGTAPAPFAQGPGRAQEQLLPQSQQHGYTARHDWPAMRDGEASNTHQPRWS